MLFRRKCMLLALHRLLLIGICSLQDSNKENYYDKYMVRMPVLEMAGEFLESNF